MLYSEGSFLVINSPRAQRQIRGRFVDVVEILVALMGQCV